MVCHRFCRFIHVHADNSSPVDNTPTLPNEETGWQRVTSLWKRIIAAEREHGDVALIRRAYGGGAMAGIVLGVCASRSAYQDFIRKHNDYTFKGQFEARRRLTDYITLQVFRLGFKMCWRVSLFCGTITLFTVSAITYRNDLYLSDFVASAALVGGLWKSRLGFKGAVSGAAVAGTFGLVFGSLGKLWLFAFGLKIPEYRHYLIDEYACALRRERARQHRREIEENHEEEFADLLEHEKRLEKVKTQLLWSDGFLDQK